MGEIIHTPEDDAYIVNANEDETLSFCQIIEKYMSRNNLTEEKLSARSGISVSTISRMHRVLPEDNRYTLSSIMACIIGMHLDFTVSYILIKKASYSLEADTKQNRAYRKILNLYYNCSVIQVNKYLQHYGLKPLAPDSRVLDPHENPPK